MTGTRGIGRRRGTRGKTVLVNGIPEGAVVNHEPAHAATQVIEMPAPSLAGDISEGLASAELREFAEALAAEPYEREAVPDLCSADPADRTEWFLLAGGTEPLFEAAVADLDAEWLLNTSLPAPPRKSGTESEEVPDGRRRLSDNEDPGSGSAPPVDEAAAETTTPASADPEPVCTDGAEDEPDAEPDCAEGGDA